jgi:hypothetical protein
MTSRCGMVLPLKHGVLKRLAYFMSPVLEPSAAHMSDTS